MIMPSCIHLARLACFVFDSSVQPKGPWVKDPKRGAADEPLLTEVFMDCASPLALPSATGSSVAARPCLGGDRRCLDMALGRRIRGTTSQPGPVVSRAPRQHTRFFGVGGDGDRLGPRRGPPHRSRGRSPTLSPNSFFSPLIVCSRGPAAGSGRGHVGPNQMKLATVQQFPLDGFTASQTDRRGQRQRKAHVESGLLSLGAHLLEL